METRNEIGAIRSLFPTHATPIEALYREPQCALITHAQISRRYIKYERKHLTMNTLFLTLILRIARPAP
jgi:hypothetical protein